MPGCMYELQITPPEAEPLAILCYPHARGGIEAALDALRAPVAPRKAAVAA